MLALFTRVLLWASVGLLVWYLLTRAVPRQYLTWFGGFILVVLLAVSYIDPNDGTIGIIWRVLSFPLTPLGATIVSLGVALNNLTKNVKTPIIIALSILLFSSTPAVSQLLVSSAERSVARVYQERRELCGEVCPADVPEAASIANAAAIIVMGNSRDVDRAVNTFNTTVDASLNTALAPRLIYSASLYRQARASGADPIILVTAGSGNEDSDQRNVIRNILINNGVFGEDIVVENTGLNIYESARRTESLLQNRGAISARAVRRQQGTQDDPRVFVVAPAIIMSRAALTFEELALEVVAKPTDFYTDEFRLSDASLDRVPELIPNVDALQLTTRYWNELLNSMYYFLRGWLPDFNFGWDSNIEI